MDTQSRILVKYDFKNFNYDDDNESDDDESNNSNSDNGQNGNHLTLDNSFLYVGQDAYVNKLTVTNNSKMCINRNLFVYSYNNFSVASNSLFVKGTVNKWDLVSGNGKDKVYGWVPVSGLGGTTDDVFLAQCGSSVPASYQINWPNEITTTIDIVDY